jgi:hypothetical protein
VGPSTNRQAAGTPSGTAGGRLWLVVVDEVTPRPARGLRCLEWMSGSSALINDHDPVDVQEPTSSDADRRPAYLQVSTALGAYKLVSGRSSVRSRPPARCAPDQGRHQRTITRTGSLGASRACKAYRLPGLGRAVKPTGERIGVSAPREVSRRAACAGLGGEARAARGPVFTPDRGPLRRHRGDAAPGSGTGGRADRGARRAGPLVDGAGPEARRGVLTRFWASVPD